MSRRKVSTPLITVLVIVVLLIAAIAADIVSTKLHRSWDSLSPTDQQMLTEFTTYEQAEQADPSWPGVSVTDHPVVVLSTASRSAYLINPTSAPSGVGGAAVTGQPSGEAGASPHIYRLNRLHPQAIKLWLTPGNFNSIATTYQLAGNEVYFVKAGDQAVTAPNSSEHFITFLAHESFHYFGQDSWKLDSSITAPLSARGRELLGVKLQLLDDIRAALSPATGTPDAQLLNDLAGRYLDNEAERATADPDYVAQEQWRETVEGTAEYMGIKASNRVGYDYGVMYFDNTKDVPFSEVLPYIDSGEVPESFLTTRLSYETGAQLALLLDSLDPTGAWKQQLTEQTADAPVTLVDVLGESMKNPA